MSPASRNLPKVKNILNKCLLAGPFRQFLNNTSSDLHLTSLPNNCISQSHGPIATLNPEQEGIHLKGILILACISYMDSFLPVSAHILLFFGTSLYGTDESFLNVDSTSGRVSSLLRSSCRRASRES